MKFIRVIFTAVVLLSFLNNNYSQAEFIKGFPTYLYGNVVKCGTYHFTSDWDCLYRSNANHTGWEKIFQWPDNRTFWSLHSEGDQLFAAISNGNVYSSVDFGKSFSLISSQVAPSPPNNFFQTNDSIIYLSGLGHLSISRDGGQTFQSKFVNMNAGPAAYYLQHGVYLDWVSSQSKLRIFRSNDHFRTYISDNESGIMQGRPLCLEVVNGIFILGISGSSNVYYSDDFGVTWDSSVVDPAVKEIYDFTISNDVIWAATNIGAMKSSGNIQEWTRVPYDNEELNTWPENGPYTTDIFASGDTLYASLYHAVILRSLDGGNSWHKFDDGVIGNDIFSLYNDGRHLSAGTNDGAFYYDNNAKEWKIRKSWLWGQGFDIPNSWNFYNWHFIEHSEFVYRSKLFQSVDDGTVWEEISSNSITAFDEINDTLWYSAGYKLYFSANEGNSWNLHSSYAGQLFEPITSIERTSDRMLFLCSSIGDPGYIYEVTLNGKTPKILYSSISVSEPDQLIKVDSIIVVNGFRGGIPMSTDTGQTWTFLNLPLPPSTAVSSVNYINGIIIVGTTNGLWAYSIKHTLWTEIDSFLFGKKEIYATCIFNQDVYISAEETGIYKLDLDLIECLLDPTRDDCGKISGDMIINRDIVCQKDSADSPLFGGLIEITPGPAYAIIQPKGDFIFPLNPGTYRIKPVIDRAYHTLVCPDSGYYQITLDNNQVSKDSLLFEWLSISDVNDLEITIVEGISTRPDRPGKYYIIINNTGTLPQKPIVECMFSPLLHFDTANITPFNLSGNTITWELDTLHPGMLETIQVSFIADGAAEIGDSLEFKCTVFPFLIDTIPDNNCDTLLSFLAGSFDPNDKIVKPSGRDINGYVPLGTNTFFYTIRFQNTGNDTAFSVYILDTLHESFDLSTLQLIATSPNNVHASIVGQVLKFNFPAIFLPDSTTNYEESQGFVHYSIQTKNILPSGESVSNQAFIYFDLNTPVATNVTYNTIDFPQGIEGIEHPLNELQVFPNPTKGTIFIRLPPLYRNGTLKVFSSIGECIQTYETIDQETVSLSIAPRQAQSIYFVAYFYENQLFSWNKVFVVP